MSGTAGPHPTTSTAAIVVSRRCDFIAREWTLTYYLRKDGTTATSFSATADCDTHLVTVAATTTAGVYDMITIYPVFTQIIAKS
jgi:hypothetical protein